MINDKREVWGWTMYDWANSAFSTTVVAALFAPYIIELAKGNTNSRSFYDIKIKKMNATISHKLIVAANRENKYFQKISYI